MKSVEINFFGGNISQGWKFENFSDFLFMIEICSHFFRTSFNSLSANLKKGNSFTFRSHQCCKKFIKKEKLKSREQSVCVRQTSVCSIFILNKITALIFQIIYILNKTLDHCVNGGLERRHKVQTHLQGLFTFWN